ncbi:MAG: threonylcarbamoyl-AMP synthase [Alphaproteobacteria bacterium]|nr:threonylcarbamoyl-AMP synthase [Alphaproteobacteria bacterium]
MARTASQTQPSSLAAATPEAIAAAADHLRAGRLVAFPTETVYGLGADATDDRALAAVFAAKARPRFNPLIVHVTDVAAVERIAELVPLGARLAERFWPGPLTLVLHRRTRAGLSLLASAGLPTVAIRVPAHPVARALLEAAERPIAAPSANPSGQLSPTLASHVAAGLGHAVAMVLDGGPTPLGLESTVIDVSGAVPRLLRPGAIPREEIEIIAGALEPGPADGLTPASPGRLAHHYAPGIPLRTDARVVAASEALLAFGPRPLGGAATMRNLSPTGDLREAAANLFAMLHELDDPRFSAIAVMPIPTHGLGEAINDRLTRAARR